MKEFKKTWRHEIIIKANSKEEAKEIWQNIELGNLDKEVDNKKIFSHQFIESISFQDENYNDIK